MRKKIIIIFPSNLGDVILALPVLDFLKSNYPQSSIAAISSPRTVQLLKKNNFLDDVVVFDKKWPLKQKIRFAFFLRGKYDFVVDLKHSLLPAVMGGNKRTPLIRMGQKRMHLRDKFISLLKGLNLQKKNIDKKSRFILEPGEENKWNNADIPEGALFVACSSNSRLKQYYLVREVVEDLKSDYPVVLLGVEKDKSFYGDLASSEGVISLLGKTRVQDVFYLLSKYAGVLLAVDSGILHIGSYLNIPTVAVFGPTEEKRFGPYSEHRKVLRKRGLSCSPCGKSRCINGQKCMDVDPDRVINAIHDMYRKAKK